ncbi:hypothetical protein MMC30_008763 [Trapelia coarctata]|nr:hypothetical protein [Trapelia coarctata]
MNGKNIQAVLGHSFADFGVEAMRLHIGEPFIGRGVFSTDGTHWKHSRDLIKPMFTKAQISNFSALDVHLDRMMEWIPRDCSTIDLQTLLKLMFLDNSTEVIFGKSTETLLAASPDAQSNELLQTFDAALRGLGKRILLGRLRILIWWDRSYGRLAQRVHAVIDKYIDEALVGQKEEPLLHRPQRSMLDEFLVTVKDRAEVRNHLLNIFLPARDGTAIGLSGVCFLLARNPQIWRKLRAEVLLIKGPVTYSVLKSLNYMRWVINESFRLITPAHSNTRLCLRNCILPSGGGHDGTAPIFVPRGTQVTVNFGAMHRDKDIWGEDAEDFRPERWDGFEPGWHYIPFSGGPRICPGQQIALTETAYVLVRLLQEFKDIENRDPEIAFIEESRLIVESRNGVMVGLIPAEKEQSPLVEDIRPRGVVHSGPRPSYTYAN